MLKWGGDKGGWTLGLSTEGTGGGCMPTAPSSTPAPSLNTMSFFFALAGLFNPYFVSRSLVCKRLGIHKRTRTKKKGRPINLQTKRCRAWKALEPLTVNTYRQTKRFFSTTSSSSPPPNPPPPPNMSCAELVSGVRMLAKQGAKNADPASVNELAAAAIALSSQMDAK